MVWRRVLLCLPLYIFGREMIWSQIIPPLAPNSLFVDQSNFMWYLRSEPAKVEGGGWLKVVVVPWTMQNNPHTQALFLHVAKLLAGFAQSLLFQNQKLNSLKSEILAASRNQKLANHRWQKSWKHKVKDGRHKCKWETSALSCGQRIQGVAGNKWGKSGRQVWNHANQSTQTQSNQGALGNNKRQVWNHAGREHRVYNWRQLGDECKIMRAKKPETTGRQGGDKWETSADQPLTNQASRAYWETSGGKVWNRARKECRV